MAWDATKEARLAALKEAKARATGTQQSDIGLARGIMKDVAQTVTLGFSDELKAFGETLLSTAPGADYGARFAQSYDDLSARNRAQLAQYRAEHPVVSAAAQAAPALAAIPLAARSLTTSMGREAPDVIESIGRRLLRGGSQGAATGAATGVVAGAGTAEPGERTRGAAIGGAIGGPMGGAFGGLFGVAAPTINAALTRRTVTPETRATRAIETRMAEEGYTPAEVVGEATAMGSRARIADVSPGLSQMVATASKQPSTARRPALEFAEERSRGASGRIMGNLARNLGPPEQFNAQMKSLDEVMRREAGPQYEIAYQDRIQPTPFMQNLLANEDNRAAKLWRGPKVEGLAREDAIAQGQDFNPMSLYNPDGTPSLKGWDFLKRAMWDAEQRAGPKTSLGSAIRRQRQQLTRDLRDQSEAYGQALDAWSGGRGVQEAMELGRKGIRKNSMDVRDELDDLNDRERQGYRLGYARELLGLIEGEGFKGGQRFTADTAKVFDRPDAQRSLEVVFGSRDDARSFIESALTETRFQRTYDAMRGGSPTYPHLAEAQSQQGQGVADAALGYLTGTQSLPQAAISLARRSRPTIPSVEPEYAGALTRQLLLESPAAFIARTGVAMPRGVPFRAGAMTAGAVGGGVPAYFGAPLINERF